jgi:hypothetical protein
VKREIRDGAFVFFALLEAQLCDRGGVAHFADSITPDSSIPESGRQLLSILLMMEKAPP